MTADLIAALELHLLVSDLKPSDLRAIRLAGGEYSDVRGNAERRVVRLPADSAKVFGRLVARATSGFMPDSPKRVVICRGPIERFYRLQCFLKPSLTLAAVERLARERARQHGKACSCCGTLIPVGSSLRRCPDCHEERGHYEKAKLAAEAAGRRYELAERCLWASNEGVMAIFEELGRKTGAP